MFALLIVNLLRLNSSKNHYLLILWLNTPLVNQHEPLVNQREPLVNQHEPLVQLTIFVADGVL